MMKQPLQPVFYVARMQRDGVTVSYLKAGPFVDYEDAAFEINQFKWKKDNYRIVVQTIEVTLT